MGAKAEESAAFARKAVEQAHRLREERAAEREQQKKDKNMSWKQKVRRRRRRGSVRLELSLSGDCQHVAADCSYRCAPLRPVSS